MKSIPLAFTACLLSLILVVRAELDSRQPTEVTDEKTPLAKKGGESNGPPLAPIPTSTTLPQTSTISRRSSVSSSIIPSIQTSPISSMPITETTTLSLIPAQPPTSLTSEPTLSSSSTRSFFPTTTVVSTDGLLWGPSSATSAEVASIPMASSTTGNGLKMNDGRRTLIIVLSSVLGTVGLMSLALAVCLIRRYQKGQRPFSHRGASPIDDEEIASWRAPSSEHKVPMLPEFPPPVAEASTIGLAHFPGWMWNSQLPKATQPPPISRPSTIIPESPSSMARAPNSRAGLTDETVPGAEAYIPPIKRRLSKAPPPGHMRSKSRRSSTSNRSIWSYNGPSTLTINVDGKTRDRHATWYDPENGDVGRELRDYDHSSSSPGTSVFDVTAGGLSPRPSSRPRLWANASSEKEIGRAIA